VMMLAERWYLRCGLSYRDLEELLAERGVEVDHVTLGAVALADRVPVGCGMSRRRVVVAKVKAVEI